ncbi:MAG: GNAT family N-acetyltransferase [Dehalococcoidia bacterium]|nr:GNAT family N-acetyltransferase [Dehalococcoidia bacterium]
MPPVPRLSAYPKEISLRDGSTVTLRPMEQTDNDKLLSFFLSVSEDDRYYLKEDVTSPKVIERWAKELDYNRALPLLAFADGRVVADATLVRHRSGARRHIGEVRILVEPGYRNRGLGTLLLNELVMIAYHTGLERLTIEAVAEREETAIQTAERVGFVRLALLPQHCKDSAGKPQDLVILELPLNKWYEWWQF